MADLISRAAALDALDNERKVLIEQERFGAEHVVVHHARRLIEDLPAVDAIPVEWLKKVQTECVCDVQQIPMYVAIGWLRDMWQKEQEAQDG